MRGSVFAPVMLGMMVLVASAPATEPPPRREPIDAQMLLDLDLLSDERFAARARHDRAVPEAQDDFDFPDPDDRDRRGDQPRR
jgi:hypothetical protein